MYYFLCKAAMLGVSYADCNLLFLGKLFIVCSAIFLDVLRILGLSLLAQRHITNESESCITFIVCPTFILLFLLQDHVRLRVYPYRYCIPSYRHVHKRQGLWLPRALNVSNVAYHLFWQRYSGQNRSPYNSHPRRVHQAPESKAVAIRFNKTLEQKTPVVDVGLDLMILFCFVNYLRKCENSPKQKFKTYLYAKV